MARFTYEELWQCAKREVRQRHSVYDRLIRLGKMTPEKRDKEIAMMQEIVELLALLMEDERREKAALAERDQGKVVDLFNRGE